MSRGTTLAQAPGVQDVGPGGMWRAQRDRFFLQEAPKTSRYMQAVGCIVQLAVLGILWEADYPLWRILALFGVYVAFAIVHRIVMHATRSTGHVEAAFIAMNVSAQLFVVTNAALTGGIRSPFLPNTIIPALVSLL